MVNRDNLGDLAHDIGMFSPEDINRIMRAIAQDNKVQEMQKEIDDDTNSLGDSADKATFQIGGQSFTLKEWEKLIEKIDGQIEAIQEEQDEEAQRETTEKQLTKAQLDKILKDSNERAFESYGPGAPDEVKQAWLEAAEETGANGAGLDADGMATHITAMSAERAVKWINGDSDYADTLGNSVGSAIEAAKQALSDLEDPLQPLSMRGTAVQEQIEKEKAFYNSFLEKLQSL